LSGPETAAADRDHASQARRPGRPASDAPERILNAAYEVLRSDGYVGLTTAKVAAKSGQNKAMISYYFGSKRGLVAATARRVSETLTDKVLAEVDGARTPGQLVTAMTDALWAVMDRDPGLQRVYFDLSSHAVVDKEVGGIMLEMKEGHRAIVREVLRGLDAEIAADELDAIAIFIISGLEGLSLERLDRGDSPALRRAREIFIRSAIDAIVAGHPG
jgi:AcrR family transcriptional regulator